MADEALRELERTVLASPEDGPARLALAHGLARAGRRDEALAALDLKAVPQASFPEARALADSLWRDALSRLQPAWSVEVPYTPSGLVFDPAGRLLVAIAPSGGHGLLALDAATGETLLHDEQVASFRAHGVEGGALLQVGRTALVRLRLEAGRVERERRACDPDEALLDVDPSGDRLLLAGPRGSVVRRWPDLRAVAGPFLAGTTIDWGLDLALSEVAGGALEVRPLAGGAPRLQTVPLPFHAQRHEVGPGLHACTGSGLALVHVGRGWSLLLAAPSDRPESVATPSLASDGRGLRLHVGYRPARVELDQERGALVGPPPDLSAPPRSGGGPFHPHADAWARVAFWLGERIPGVEAFDGTRLLRLPDDHAPRRWSPDGRSLLCTVWQLGRTTTGLSMWRVT